MAKLDIETALKEIEQLSGKEQAAGRQAESFYDNYEHYSKMYDDQRQLYTHSELKDFQEYNLGEFKKANTEKTSFRNQIFTLERYVAEEKEKIADNEPFKKEQKAEAQKIIADEKKLQQQKEIEKKGQHHT